ncbi:permease [Novosphingobium album (ex Hu et al. 2023)]|uniref:Permease n=1 Tax=Novosphingobium album (ex Hu et al. 2023) TaxID=2930093 RepID=A0ABT0AX70_9SPHN|nr:permease [Novosphingobium album (ex Hu et al. 2023)]MCJ2177372.1 permease [Novosphingobium album (ex Hu et al. 2023)]
MNTHALSLQQMRKSQAVWFAGLAAALALWFALYWQLLPSAQWLVAQTGIAPGSHLASSVEFFFYDTPKVLMLLTLVVFAMGVVRTFFSPEHTRALLAGKREGLGNIAAAHLGIVTPFCSCSAVPLFVGFVSAGVPLGVTFSFLIAAPMVNEIALGLLFALVGWKVALTYLAFGLTVAIVAGWVIGRLHLEHWLEPWVREVRAADTELEDIRMTWVDRFEAGWDAVKEIVGKVWYWIIAGIAAGAFIHGYVPAELLSHIMGADSWWSVPAAVLLGIPMYSNAAGIIPVIEALIGKGAALGTVLAFMMSVIALSFPEMIILRKVLSLKLIAVFIAVVGSGILAVGFLFNALFS